MKGTVGELGEFGLIRELTSRLTTTPAVRVGPGDDAAVVAAPDRRVVASTDILLEGRHFRRDWSTAYDVGRKAAAQNLADIAAMGAVPTALLLVLVVPAELPVTWPSSRMSVLATTRRSGAATTAASSPGPTRTAGVVVRREVSSLMSPNSPSSPTVPFIALTPLLCRAVPGRASSVSSIRSRGP